MHATDLELAEIQCYHLYYPMTSVEISGERLCRELCDFPTCSDPYAHGSWDRSKNLYPLRNHIIPNMAAARVPRTTQLVASWFLDPNGCLIGSYAMFQLVWVLTIRRYLRIKEMTRFEFAL